jgi:hypothetical protein
MSNELQKAVRLRVARLRKLIAQLARLPMNTARQRKKAEAVAAMIQAQAAGLRTEIRKAQ